MKTLFIHRSVGQNMLDDTDFRQRVKGVDLYDINANTHVLTQPDGSKVASPVTLANGSTEPEALTTFFADDVNQEFLGTFDTVIVKSCYTASAVNSDEREQTQKQTYASLIEYAKAHPKQRFIICLSPPRKRLFTNKAAIVRARSVHGHVQEIAKNVPNLVILDLLKLLGNDKGTLAKQYCRIAFFDMHPNKAGSRVFADALRSKI